MNRALAITLLWCSITACAHAAELFTVAPELWDRPRSARAVLDQAAVRQAVVLHLSQPGSQLVIHHDYGQTSVLHAEELRVWLMALAIDSARIRLLNDLAPSEPSLKIEVLR